MVAVVAAVVRCGVVGSVGRDGSSRPFGCHVVMIVHKRIPVVSAARGPPISGRCSRLHLMCAARAVLGARLRIYKSQEREGEVPYINT
jgi:hypothetical protein